MSLRASQARRGTHILYWRRAPSSIFVGGRWAGYFYSRIAEGHEKNPFTETDVQIIDASPCCATILSAGPILTPLQAEPEMLVKHHVSKENTCIGFCSNPPSSSLIALEFYVAVKTGNRTSYCMMQGPYHERFYFRDICNRPCLRLAFTLSCGCR
ncbi:hypothetical protein ARMGADRAFT_318918 [Armillaria gallica]|uniref:Uncharacterized protein n=1 Tax=Armillaria gallica TaxID=47427 RepID=A0A2H3D3J9_ARMGA|nr:hypothetical protein ARMGADRAFT_318918 [Armillaria gallica]